jgi:hypothetical protein
MPEKSVNILPACLTDLLSRDYNHKSTYRNCQTSKITIFPDKPVVQDKDKHAVNK